MLRQVASLFLLIAFLSSAIMSLARLQDPLPPWIAFSSFRDGYLKLYRMRWDGRNQQHFIYYSFSSDTMLSWSPDGQWILFVSYWDILGDIYRMRPYGNHAQRLSSNPRERWGPKWSPNGQWILFVSREYLSEANIYRMRPDGSEQERLTQNSHDNFDGSWSPDGMQIVFVAGQTNNLQIHIMNADGSEQQQLSEEPATSPTWSPDGQWILFISNREGINKLYRIRPDGSQQSPYLEHLENVREVRWAADGQHLILSINVDIYRYNIETDELIQLTDDGSSFSPAPSPIIDLPWRAGVMLLLSLTLFAFAIPPQALYKSLKRR